MTRGAALAARAMPAALCAVVALLLWYPVRIPLDAPWAVNLWEGLHDATVVFLALAAAPEAVRICRTRGSWLRDVPVLYLALCMISVVPLVGVPTLGLSYARMQWMTLGTYGALYLFAQWVARREPKVILGMAVAWFFWAMVSAARAVGSALANGRLTHDVVDAMGHTNSRAGFEVVCVLMLLGVVVHCAQGLRIASVPVLSLLTASVAISLSRGAWLALITGLVVFIAWHWGWRRAALFLVAAVALLIVLPGPIGQRARSVADGGLASNLFRIQAWGAAVSIIGENPWGGSGYDTLWFAMLSHLGSDTPTLAGRHVHNLFLQTWAETGLLGAVALGCVFVGVCRRAWSMGDKDVGLRRLVGRGVMVALAGIVAHALVDCTWRDYGQQVMFWSLTGWMTGSQEHEAWL